ncbi:MAG: hypothetical protein ACRDPW_01760 [Mycobacteriales bacterium]
MPHLQCHLGTETAPFAHKGALCYLPDLARWAAIVTQLLRHDYLQGRGAQENAAGYTYTDGSAVPEATVSYEWAHGIAEVVDALIEASLRVTRLRETSEIPWRRWEEMVPTADGWWCLPDSAPRVPLLYALRASKEG